MPATVPTSTASVTSPDNPPPVNPVPALTAVISPPAPPETVDQPITPEPLVDNTCPAVPSAAGNVNAWLNVILPSCHTCSFGVGVPALLVYMVNTPLLSAPERSA